MLKAGMANLPEDGGDHESLFTERPGSPEEEIVKLQRHDPRAVDFRNCLRTWFCKVPWSHVKRRNLERWLYWAMYNSELPEPDKIPAQYRKVMDSGLDLLQMRLGCQLEDGENPSLSAMTLTIDPVQIWSRPFAFYALVKSANWWLRGHYLREYNVRHGRHNGLEYASCHPFPF